MEVSQEVTLEIRKELEGTGRKGIEKKDGRMDRRLVIRTVFFW